MNKPAQNTAHAKPTPMMAQFLEIKRQAGDNVILFYRMGDFYEMFFEDAVKAAAALDIALTKRGKYEGADIPMCGVPFHASETYLQRLIKKGFRVAVCEQMENPKEAKKRGHKAVVRREIVRVVTPGTLTEDTLLDARASNYILAIAQTHAGATALAWADVSVGSFEVCEIDAGRLEAELSALVPREIVLSETLYQSPEYKSVLEVSSAALTPLANAKFDARAGERRLKERYNVDALDGFGDYSKPELIAAGVLLDYLELTQAGGQTELSPPKRRRTSGLLAIDPATRASLEIERTQTGSRKGSLLSVIDRTVSGPGARALAARLSRPLVDPDAINARLDGVAFFVAENTHRDKVRGFLKQAGDPARSASRLVLGRGGPRDLIAITAGLLQGESINAYFAKYPDVNFPANLSEALAAFSLANKPDLAALVRDIGKAVKENAPMAARDGNFIVQGWRPELDKLLKLRDDSRRIIASLQADYAKKTGVTALKIKHNNVLGYFIEVTPRHGDTMLSGPRKDDFIHRQTLVSGVRFTTSELVDLDAQIAQAGDKALALELEIFEGFVGRIHEQAELVRSASAALANIDVMSALAGWAVEAKAVRPLVNDGLEFRIEGGRHPVVEAALKRDGAQGFTANDCRLDASGKEARRLTLITGPNMAGKSTYLRQNALMFVLAQAGSFVPATKAVIGVADALFSRVGASDDLSRGRSTFMLEMIETAAILNQAGERTFVILDEIGRGTATFDGLSIAWAAAEHLYEVNKCRALFATHYHELTGLMDKLPLAGNACLRAKEWDGDLVFLHDVVDGAADKSYGVQVAKLAGLPAAAVERAKDVLAKLEADSDGADALGGLPLFSAPKPAAKAKPSPIDKAVADMDVDELSPREALDLLYELKTISESR
ncbi:MAG: DNA mismatch repair protein MutS [Robiginitomaculum sp.]|nr:DNA mismatch repair protein MutS [Robiginitomaculum sp.]